jgi:hypothetical protein
MRLHPPDRLTRVALGSSAGSRSRRARDQNRSDPGRLSSSEFEVLTVSRPGRGDLGLGRQYGSNGVWVRDWAWSSLSYLPGHGAIDTPLCRHGSKLYSSGNSDLSGDPHFTNGAATFMRMPIVGMFHTSERASGKFAVYRIA